MGDIDLEKHKKYRSFSYFDVVFERAVLEINRFIITPISHKNYLFFFKLSMCGLLGQQCVSHFSF